MPAFSPESIEVGSHLYLTAAPGIEVGTRLRGGHFRKAVEKGIATDHASILDLVWELVRAREFPSRPCRFDVLFLWQGEAHARAWHHHQDILGPETGSRRGLYEVEVERISRIWAADMDLISYIGEGETVGELMQRARRYWGSTSTKSDPEILLDGEVRVAGWIGLEIEGLHEVLRPQRGMEPVLVTERGPLRYRPDDEGCETRFEIDDPRACEAAKECASGGRRSRPVLICDREAAHYWQLPSCWDGQIFGEWTRAGS